jgi:hypothetical protein
MEDKQPKEKKSRDGWRKVLRVAEDVLPLLVSLLLRTKRHK